MPKVIIATSDSMSKSSPGFDAISLIDGTSYESSIFRFEQVKNSSILILDNRTRELDEATCTMILFAMLNKKPVILLDLPNFSASVSTFIQEVIENKLNKIFICNLAILDAEDADNFLSKDEDINYLFTTHEKTLIRAQIRSFFRNSLLDRTISSLS